MVLKDLLSETTGYKEPNMMRYLTPTIALTILILLVFLFFFPAAHSIYALAHRDVEFVFLITDKETGQPIAKAKMD